jgi:hypothetical protein
MDTKLQQTYMRRAFQAFLDTYRELLASFDRPQIADSLSAYSTMGNLDEMFEIEPDIKAYLKFNEQAFLTLYDRGTIAPVTPLTQLGEQDLAKMRRSTGIGVEQLPPPPVPQPTAQELLEQRVISDWKTLKSSDFKRNCVNDRKYKETFERLAAENKLDSVATSHHDLRSLVS